MKKYLAYDACNHEYEEFETIQEAREWLEDGFLDADEGYNPDMTHCKIYELLETVEYRVTDEKSNYDYDQEDEVPEGDNESTVWPYDSAFDEIGEHIFVKPCLNAEQLEVHKVIMGGLCTQLTNHIA